MIQIKVVKESKFYPVVGKVHDVEPSPRMRVLMHKGYIVKVEGAVVEPEPTPVPYAPIPEETEVTDTTEQARAADDELPDDAESIEDVVAAVEVDGVEVQGELVEDDAPGEPEDDEGDEDPDDDV